jgi:hypothetical protein
MNAGGMMSSVLASSHHQLPGNILDPNIHWELDPDAQQKQYD